jgi:SAM-dependent methyltransferase
MRNRDKWRPTKYVYSKGKLVASRDPREVGVQSRLIADIVARFYGEHIRHHAKGRLLDLGCGTAPLFLVYKDYATEVTCVDWANSLHKNEYLDVECDLTEPLPFDDGTFDTIILSDVLEHIPGPDRLWAEMFRILAAEGRIVMNVPFYYWLHECPHDYYRYTEFALRRFVESAGLKLVLLQSIGGAPEVISDVFAKSIVRLPRIGVALAMVSQWLARRFIETGFGGRVSRSTASQFPLGYFLVAEKQKPGNRGGCFPT